METKSTPENTSTTSKQSLTRRIAIAGCAAVVVLGLGTVFYINATSAPVPAAQEQKAEKSVSVSIKPKGVEDMTKDSTPLIVHLKGADEDTRKVDTYHAITAQEIKDNKAQVEVVPGTYEISWITPINKDGSLYEVPAKKTVVLTGEDKQTWLAKSDAQDLVTTQAATKAATTQDNQQETTKAATDAASTQAASTGTKDTTSFEGNEVSPELKKVDADKVSDKQKEDALKAIEEATKKGDETLSGDAGKKVVETAKENTLQQPSEEKKDESKPEEAKQEEKKDEQKPEDKPDNKKTEAKEQTSSSNTKAEKPANNQGNKNNANSNKGNSKPKGHYETVPVYETRPVYKTVPVYESQPVYDTVEYFLTSNGRRFDNDAALESYMEDMALKNDVFLSYSLETEYVQVGTKQVQVGTKQVQTGTQQVQVGTKQVWVAD